MLSCLRVQKTANLFLIVPVHISEHFCQMSHYIIEASVGGYVNF
jgi:hypothetical protein